MFNPEGNSLLWIGKKGVTPDFRTFLLHYLWLLSRLNLRPLEKEDRQLEIIRVQQNFEHNVPKLDPFIE
jgi:hypothetical protein